MSLNTNIILCRNYTKWNNNITGILNQIKITSHRASFTLVILMSDDYGDTYLARSGFCLRCQIVHKHTRRGRWLGDIEVTGADVDSLNMLVWLDVKSFLFEVDGDYEVLVYLKNTGTCIAHTSLKVCF